MGKRKIILRPRWLGSATPLWQSFALGIFWGSFMKKPVIPVIPVMAGQEKSCYCGQKLNFRRTLSEWSSCHKPVITCHKIICERNMQKSRSSWSSCPQAMTATPEMVWEIRRFRPSALPAMPCEGNQKPVRNLSANLSAPRRRKLQLQKIPLSSPFPKGGAGESPETFCE